MTVEELITLLNRMDPKFLHAPVVVEGWGTDGKSIAIRPRGFLAQDRDKMGQQLVILR